MASAAPPYALLQALELLRAPALAEAVRRQGLLADTMMLIRIAGGCSKSCASAAQATGRPPELIKQAAILYLQQALFCPGASSYRVLGVAPDAPQERLHEHMRWLMRWLHPDRNQSEWEAVFARRVLSAWDDVKSPARRARYDRLLCDQRRAARDRWPPPRRGRWSGRVLGLPMVAVPLTRPPRSRSWRWLGAVALGIAVYLLAWMAPAPQIPSPWSGDRLDIAGGGPQEERALPNSPDSVAEDGAVAISAAAEQHHDGDLDQQPRR